MAYSEKLSKRIKAVLDQKTQSTEVKMMGGIVFMVNGNMCCGASGDSLMVRVGATAREAALTKPFTRPMEFSGRSPKGFILVDAEGCSTKKTLRAWIEHGLEFVATLPAKKPKANKVARKKTKPTTHS